jgi:putative two-component system response regulator
MMAAYLWLSVNQQGYLEQKVHEQTVDIRRANEEVIDRLVSAAQWSDEETGMHIRRTGLLCEVLARAAGWFGDDVECIRQAAPMHDIGKIGIPDAILQKPGKLTPEEFAVMKTHTRIGADILAGSKSPVLQMAREIALNHHERWDGKGYPRGLTGKAIPEPARIVAIVDVYDALSHDRIYRPALPEAEVLTIMQQGAGNHFDPLLMTFFFLHFSEIRRIAQEHPDDSWVGKRTFAWGGNAPAINDGTAQSVEPPVASTDQSSAQQPASMPNAV